MRTVTWISATIVAAAVMIGGTAVAAPADPPPNAWGGIEQFRTGVVAKTGIDQDGTASVTPGQASGTQQAPVGVKGNGAGANTDCSWRPVGPIEEINAAVAAAAAAEVPDVSDPAYVEDVIQGGPGPGREVKAPWYRWDGNFGEVKGIVTCPGSARAQWRTLGPGADGTPVVQITAADLLPDIHAQVVRQLPTPIARIVPADEDEHGYTFVNNRTFFWVDQAQGQWHTVSGSTAAAGISVTVTAEPVSLVVDPGDGQPSVTCPGAPVAVTRAAYRPDIDGCSYTYVDSSAMAPNGQTFPVRASIVWHVAWSASTGEGGDLGYVSTTSAARDLPVAEVQAIVTAQAP